MDSADILLELLEPREPPAEREQEPFRPPPPEHLVLTEAPPFLNGTQI